MRVCVHVRVCVSMCVYVSPCACMCVCVCPCPCKVDTFIVAWSCNAVYITTDVVKVVNSAKICMYLLVTDHSISNDISFDF